MTKISLVQLSQMENKPKKLKFKNTEFTLQTSSCYVDKFKVGLDNYIYFEEFNEPLIEIVEEELLTDEDKECLRNLIKMSNIIEPKYITKLVYAGHITIEIINDIELEGYNLKTSLFLNLCPEKEYKISDLGLYDEE